MADGETTYVSVKNVHQLWNGIKRSGLTVTTIGHRLVLRTEWFINAWMKPWKNVCPLARLFIQGSPCAKKEQVYSCMHYPGLKKKLHNIAQLYSIWLNISNVQLTNFFIFGGFEVDFFKLNSVKIPIMFHRFVIFVSLLWSIVRFETKMRLCDTVTSRRWAACKTSSSLWMLVSSKLQHSRWVVCPFTFSDFVLVVDLTILLLLKHESIRAGSRWPFGLSTRSAGASFSGGAQLRVTPL